MKNKIFRREYVAETVRSGVAFQIKTMRTARNMSQLSLAQLTGKTQSNIARLEDPDYGKFSLQTLLDIADAFDVWLSVQFVPFSEGIRRTSDNSPKSLNALSYREEIEAAKRINVSFGTVTTVYEDDIVITGTTLGTGTVTTSNATVSGYDLDEEVDQPGVKFRTYKAKNFRFSDDNSMTVN